MTLSSERSFIPLVVKVVIFFVVQLDLYVSLCVATVPIK